MDWTENALTALTFSLPEKTGTGSERAETSYVWAFDPASFNMKAGGEDADQVFLHGKALAGYLPSTWDAYNEKYDASLPFAMFPSMSNPRIIQQQGVFTVHPASKRDEPLKGLDELFPELFTRIKITGDREKMITKLKRLGISRSALFPEPASVADFLTNYYK